MRRQPDQSPDFTHKDIGPVDDARVGQFARVAVDGEPSAMGPLEEMVEVEKVIFGVVHDSHGYSAGGCAQEGEEECGRIEQCYSQSHEKSSNVPMICAFHDEPIVRETCGVFQGDFLYNVGAMRSAFDGKTILVTGGLGFIGSTLSIALVKLGAEVTIIDNLNANQGGNPFNIEPIKDKVTVDHGDIRDASAMDQLVGGKDYIFHLARQTDHILSLTNPFPDIDVNIRGTAILLEACKKHNPSVRLVYTGTRGQYGRAVRLPVGEDAPTNPRGIYEITNLTAEKMIGVYHEVHGIRAVMLRLTNIYGPRSQMKHDHYGVVNWFVRLAIDGRTIPVFGDGKLGRDFLYIDDAVSAILACAAIPACYGQIINVGRDKPDTFLYLVKEIIRMAKSGTYALTPFSPERAAQEPGDFASDITKIRRLTGWKPTTKLADGLTRTIAYYRRYKKHYW